MIRSTDTWHGRSYFIAVRAVAASMPSGPQAYSMTGAAGVARGELAIERRDDAAALAGAAVFGRQHELDAELAEEVEIEELLGACARRRTASSATPRARSACASVANGARPTPPATIQPRPADRRS